MYYYFSPWTQSSVISSWAPLWLKYSLDDPVFIISVVMDKMFCSVFISNSFQIYTSQCLTDIQRISFPMLWDAAATAHCYMLLNLTFRMYSDLFFLNHFYWDPVNYKFFTFTSKVHSENESGQFSIDSADLPLPLLPACCVPILMESKISSVWQQSYCSMYFM